MITAFLAGLALAADPLVGTWTADDGETFTLADGGAATYAGQPLQWYAQGGSLVLASGGVPLAAFTYRFAGQDLVLETGGQTGTYHPTASATASAGAGAPVAPSGGAAPAGPVDLTTYAGRWQAGQYTWNLYPDGTGRVGKERFQWTVEPGFVVIPQATTARGTSRAVGSRSASTAAR